MGTHKAWELGVGEVARDVGAVAAETADVVEDGRGEEGGLGCRVEGPVPVGLAEVAGPATIPESLLILGEHQTVEGVKDADKVHGFGLSLVRGDEVVKPVLDGGQGCRAGSGQETLDSLDVFGLLVVLEAAPFLPDVGFGAARRRWWRRWPLRDSRDREGGADQERQIDSLHAKHGCG
jgi:hypothetical protein